MHLTKSLYTRGIQCPKSLWLRTHEPQHLTPPDAQAQAVFETGERVGEIACMRYLDRRTVRYHGTEAPERVALTQEWIAEGVPTICEATFVHDGVLVMVDVLEIHGDGSVTIHEVKSSTWNRDRSLKDIEHYLHDAAIQYHVLRGCELEIRGCYLTLLDGNYVCDGTLDVQKLFAEVNVTEAVEQMQDEIPARLRTFRTVLSGEEAPDISIGRQCKHPYTCDAYAYCWHEQAQIPEYSVFDVFNMGEKPLGLYRAGIVRPEEIPDEYLTTDNQLLAVHSWRDRAIHIDREAIEAFLETVSYPIYHLDFETFADAIPQYPQQRPYQQICFQYSLHIEHEDGRLEHREFLGEEGTDPREPLIRRMLEDIPPGVTVLVYNQSFEKSRIREMARDFPLYADRLLSLNDQIIDLATPFQKKHYYDYRLQGKYSIKKVMPLLAPHMADAYAQLSLIHHGGEAMDAFPRLASMKPEERAAYRHALLEYCKLDTLAMVEVLRGLRKAVS
jgi:hypothetical protein